MSDVNMDIDELEDFEFDDEDEMDDEEYEIEESDSDEYEEDDDSEIEYSDTDDSEDADEYIDGTEVSEDELTTEYFDDGDEVNSFISDTGDVVIMDDDDNNDAFELIYVPIDKILIAKVIRKSKNVDGLARSVKSTGLLSPIIIGLTATEGIYVLLHGARRLLACAKAGKKVVPCVVNKNINTQEIPIITALYNQEQSYTMTEIVDFIDYLEKEKGIMSASMIEYLLQLNSGDYTKLKDILNDNDDEIVSKLFSGVYNIEQAFKKLEQRRKRESVEERENKKAEAVYGNAEESGINKVAGSGEVGTGDSINLDWDAGSLDEGLEDASLNNMVEEGSKMAAFKPHKQNVGQREYIDPAIKKAVLARDNFTCACCRRGGESFVDALDFHHILPVFLGGVDSTENGICLCLTDHKLVHLYSTGDLTIPKEKSQEEIDKMTEEERVIYNDEQMRFKRIVKLGMVIRKGIETKGISREQYKKDHPNTSIGRNKPGREQERA